MYKADILNVLIWVIKSIASVVAGIVFALFAIFLPYTRYARESIFNNASESYTARYTI